MRELRELYRYGFALRTLADAYGRSLNTVQRYINARSRRRQQVWAQRYNARGYRQSHIARMLNGARNRARRAGVPFALTEKDVVMPTKCPVLGVVLSVGTGLWHDASPTLDRLKPELGYVPNNVSVISFLANRLKSNGTPEQLRRVAEWCNGRT